jgi:hypothetical protein
LVRNYFWRAVSSVYSFGKQFFQTGRAGSPLPAANAVNCPTAARTEWRALPKSGHYFRILPGLHLSRVWMSFVCRIGHMKTGSQTKLSARVCIMALVAILALVCSGCQTFMTDKEYQAAMAREAAQNRYTFIQLKPGLLATWKP